MNIDPKLFRKVPIFIVIKMNLDPIQIFWYTIKRWASLKSKTLQKEMHLW